MIECLQREFGVVDGLVLADGEIKVWPYEPPQPTEEECVALQEKWQPLIEWEYIMQNSDYVLPRWMEDHVTGDHGGVVEDVYLQAKYDKVLALRATKPVVV